MAGQPTSARDRSRTAALPAILRPRLALTLAALLILLGTLAAWLRGLLGMFHSEAGRYDFSTYYAAAAALRANLHANIYTSTVLATAGTQAHVLVRPPLPYVYPPLLALALAPASLLSFAVLSRLWLLASALLWLAFVPLLAREIAFPLARPLDRWLGPAPAVHGEATRSGWRASLGTVLDNPALLVGLALAALLVLPAAPAIQTALTGQVDFLVLLPLALVPELSRRGHERAVGVLIGLAALLKVTPILLVGYLLLRRRWRAAGAALATVCVLTLLCCILVGPGVLLASLGALLGTGTSDAVLGHNEALFASLPGAHSGALATFFFLLRLALALAGGWVLWRLPHRASSGTSGRAAEGQTVDDRGDTAAYGIALCLMLLLVPTAWVHHYVWVLPAAAIALGLSLAALLDAWGTTRARVARWLVLCVVLACLALIWTLPHGWDTEPTPAVTTLAGLPLRPLLLELRALGTLALVGALVVVGWPRLSRSRAGEIPVETADGAREDVPQA